MSMGQSTLSSRFLLLRYAIIRSIGIHSLSIRDRRSRGCSCLGCSIFSWVGKGIAVLCEWWVSLTGTSMAIYNEWYTSPVDIQQPANQPLWQYADGQIQPATYRRQSKHAHLSSPIWFHCPFQSLYLYLKYFFDDQNCQD